MNYPLIKVVGVSASGKSTLVRNLRQAGYLARPVSQEHSQVADLWQHFDRPLFLIYLNATLETQQQRRPDVHWQLADLFTEQARLAHAREHADLHINTTDLSAEGVLAIAIAFLQNRRIAHADQPLPLLAETGSGRVVTPTPAATPTTSPERRRRRKRSRTA